MRFLPSFPGKEKINNLERKRMKVIFKIAKSELNMLFYSPVAWLILVIFTFQSSMAFSDLFGDLVVDQAIGNRLWDVTEKVFSSYRGLLSQVQQYLYLSILHAVLKILLHNPFLLSSLVS